MTADALNRDDENFKQRQSLTTDALNRDDENFKQRQSLTAEVLNRNDKFKFFITSIVNVISSSRKMINFTIFSSLNFSRIKKETSKIIDVDEYINNLTKNYTEVKIKNYNDQKSQKIFDDNFVENVFLIIDQRIMTEYRSTTFIVKYRF